ncbi:hypothetical protein Glove_353g15 [Diversispora epigaea]|uniref:Uncharacterized protein n=1 Tax=Diversispora epigaea TaxID=1348612 RepID=A0A397HBE4_9GLOM|nr:hypothetical protein Glove_353g15 [Diversispora epigaea]
MHQSNFGITLVKKMFKCDPRKAPLPLFKVGINKPLLFPLNFSIFLFPQLYFLSLFFFISLVSLPFHPPYILPYCIICRKKGTTNYIIINSSFAFGFIVFRAFALSNISSTAKALS